MPGRSEANSSLPETSFHGSTKYVFASYNCSATKVCLLCNSIHGVRYLVEAKNPVLKALWFITISFCVTSAAAIIYLNVANWSNSPAVVTSVESTLVEVSLISCMQLSTSTYYSTPPYTNSTTDRNSPVKKSCLYINKSTCSNR